MIIPRQAPNVDYDVGDDGGLVENFNRYKACDWANYGTPCKEGQVFDFEQIIERYVCFEEGVIDGCLL